jgi:hypothetical protein
MRREALTLIGLMFVGSFLMAACESKDEKSVVVTPPAVAIAPPATDPVTHAAPGTTADTERKGGPVQGQVDPKEQAQKRDFEQKKN